MNNAAYEEIVVEARKLLENMNYLKEWSETIKEINTLSKYCKLYTALREFCNVNKKVV